MRKYIHVVLSQTTLALFPEYLYIYNMLHAMIMVCMLPFQDNIVKDIVNIAKIYNIVK